VPSEIDVTKMIFVHNKIDLQNEKKCSDEQNSYISVKHQIGIDKLIQKLGKRLAGTNDVQEQGDTPYLARSRHVIALQQAQESILSAQQRLANSKGLELAAEDLRLAQQNLGEITGEFTPDDLLGKIFSEFCIGK
jgi:tRNA modification GTPase